MKHPKEFTLENLDICVLLTAPLILETGQTKAAVLVPEGEKMSKHFCVIVWALPTDSKEG